MVCAKYIKQFLVIKGLSNNSMDVRAKQLLSSYQKRWLLTQQFIIEFVSKTTLFETFYLIIQI
jgi:hypothetical protein